MNTKKKYTSPVFRKQTVKLSNTILSSDVENFSSHIAEPGDWGDPIFDPDDEIDW